MNNFELKNTYLLLLAKYEKMGGEIHYDDHYTDHTEEFYSCRNALKAIEMQLSSADIIECIYKFREQ